MKTGKSLLYSAGNFSASLSGSVFSTYVIFYYVDVLKMPAYVIGIAMGIYGIWAAISNPLLGQLSDRTRTRWGRRTPYILFGTVPFALFFTLVWTPPVRWAGANVPQMLAYFVSIILIFDTLYTLVIINWTSLFPEMYKTQEERTKVSMYRQIFGIAGNILGVALPPILYSSIGWAAMGVGFGVLTLVCLGLSLTGAHEDPTYSEGSGLTFGQSLKATFGNRSFLMFVIAAMFLQFTFVMLQAVLPFYAKYILRIEGFKVSLLLGTIFIMALFWVYFWMRRANAWGSKKTILISVAIYGLALIPFWFAKSFIGALLTAALVGVGLAGLIVLLDVMLSDIIDEDELHTGARREGIYFGVNGFMVRLTISVQSMIMGAMLATSGYNANLPVASQPTGALTGIRVLLVAIPLGSLLCAGVFYRLYPLHGETLRTVREALAAKHRAGEMKG